MNRVLVTGASGFIGRRLVQELLHTGSLTGPAGADKPIDEIVLLDRDKSGLTDFLSRHSTPKVTLTPMAGDISDPAFLTCVSRESFQSIFHLASCLTLDAEKDPGQAWLSNVQPLRSLLDEASNRPRVVFASSIAVFGGQLPETVSDDIAQAPKTSYGMHKAVCEMLIADYSRNGRVDGRCLRLPIVLTRPGPSVPVVSDNIAAIIREPHKGASVVSPLPTDSIIPVASVGSVVTNLIKVHNLPTELLPENRAMNLPSLTISIEALINAVKKSVHKSDLTSVKPCIQITPRPDIKAIVDSWPKVFVSSTASKLGLGADPNLDTLINDYLQHLQKETGMAISK